ncbi:MAG TPA: cell division protein FtsA, partial [Gemmatirosa sp.]
YPEALVFAPAGRGDSAGGTSGGMSGATLGIALVPRPPEPPGLSGAWRVGIDFGTSNTNVFRQSTATNLAERWRFEFDRYLFDVTARRPTRDGVLREFFVPPEPVELPIPTSLRIFEDARKTHALLDYAIFFSTQYELPRNVHADIKWDGEEELNTKPFLKSLLFLLLIEVGLQRVARVTLACSYPKAFSLSLRSRYEGAWEGVVKELLDDPATAVFIRRQGAGTRGPEVSNPEFHTEGVAAGEFFASEMTIPDLADRANKQIAAVALDVGGGTTDISIWHRNEIVFDASILLAGRQISRLLQQSPRVLEVLFSPEAAHALEQKRNEPTAFAARLNVVLKREENAIRDRLIDHANNREVQWIRRVLAIEFGAIAFYTASLLGAVNAQLGGELARSIEGRAIRLHWGGNAAKLINWIDFGRYDEAGIASKMLNALLFNALKDVPMQVPAALLAEKQSPGHKSEAAGGLVVMHPVQQTWRDGGGAVAAADDDFSMPAGAAPNAGDAAAELDMPDDGAPGAAPGFSPDIVSGENVELTTGPVGHLQTVSGRMLFDGTRTRFRSTSLDRLKRFVEIVNYFGVRFGLFTEDSKIMLDARRQGQIADAVLARFVEAERLREGQRVIEPVFITEVKILLDILRTELR